MTTSIVLYLLATSLVASAAAWAADEGLRRAGLPSRWLWIVGMAAPPALLVMPSLVPGLGRGSDFTGLPVGPVVELPALVLGAPSGVPSLATSVAVAWGLSSVAMALLLLRGALGLSRERGAWERSDVLGRSVYVSRDRGPAIAGVLRPWIVLPRWSLSLPGAELGLVLLHEEEHVRAGDSVLLAAGLGFVVLTPWNPSTWWQLRRLRMAMEVDCDRRVLSREPDRERYGRSLLSVAARASGASLGLASFTERSLSLERRILAMTFRRSRWTPMWACALVSLALVIFAQACNVESPIASVEPGAGMVAADGLFGTSDVPSFTPFTVAPAILNRQEVVDAMEASYPPLLREAGIGGTVRVYFRIDSHGDVANVLIDQSSGHPAIDEAALRVAGVYHFSPAKNREDPVPVWVSFPITFQVK